MTIFTNEILLRAVCVVLIISQVQCTSQTFDIVGNSAYYIGEGYKGSEIFDWLEARQRCRADGGQLISIQSETKLNDLQKYIVDKRFANGSRFFTSGHSFLSPSPFKWEGLQVQLTYSKWLPGDGPRDSRFLSLQLIDSELFMVTSIGFDEYYICEYETWSQKMCKIVRNPETYCIALILILMFVSLVILLQKILRTMNKKRSGKDVEKELFI